MLTRRNPSKKILPVMFLSGLFLILPSVSATGQPEPAYRGWLGEDNAPLPFRSDGEVLEFLRTAEVVSSERTGEGINNPWRVELEKDGVLARGCFRDVSVRKQEAHTRDGVQLNFRDDAIFEVAAYELGKLLGIRNIPPAVKRRILKSDGSVQLWLENAMTESSRLEQGLTPPDLGKWRYQYELMILFDNLIYNDDRNQGNVLFDKDWNRWLIDHTRSFRTFKKLSRPELVKRCDRKIWEKLGQLDRQLLDTTLGDYLSGSQIEAILARRDLLLDLLQARIDKFGERAVLIETPDFYQ